MKSPSSLGKFRPVLVPVILLALFLFALALRGIPALYAPPNGALAIYDTDTWYTLRQIEVMVHSFPQYNWFDPMTAYPVGKFIGWGPLYPALAALLNLLAGATTRNGIIATSMWLNPLLGACMVPVMYLLGKVVWNWRTGLVAAVLVSFTSFALFFHSSYGYIDHHITEVLFTSLFFLTYCYTLSRGREDPPDFSRLSSLLPVCLLSLLGGLLFFAGILASPTVVFVTLIIGIYTLIQVTLDTLGGRQVLYLALMNTIIFGIASLALLAFGIRTEGLVLGFYSIGHLYVYGAIIAWTIILSAISWFARGRKTVYFASLAILGIAGFLLVFLVPPLRSIADQGIAFLTGSEVYSLGIQEMLPWSPVSAWRNFNFLPVLMAGGFIILALGLRRERLQERIFIAVWAVSLLALTILHIRFEYYLAVPLILLSALCIVETLSWGLPVLRAWVAGWRGGAVPGTSLGERPGEPQGPRKKTARKSRKPRNPEKPAKTDTGERNRGAAAILAAVVLILLVSGAVISLVQDVQFGMATPYRQIPGEWTESLLWLESGTPNPGVDYFGRYDPETFTYPPGSYGILANWDAGHWITFFSHRIPNVNPFQDNLIGPEGGAAFFLAPSEERADPILDGLGTRYVITDAWTSTTKFTTLIPWVDTSVNTTPYLSWFFIPDPGDRSRLNLDSYYTDGYFQSMIVRLHFLDGSMTLPTTVKYIEYMNRQVPGEGETAPMNTVGPVITRIQDLDAGVAAEKAASVNADPQGGRHATVLSELPNHPIREIPALSRFRLVFESSSRVAWEGNFTQGVPEDVRYIKVFEYVKGAHIRGNGIIELPLITNTGRTFTFREESMNGEFIVPYSTTGNPYGVKATGPYRIAGSTATYEVSETDVLTGRTVGP